jgi:hypothetical protein
VAQTAHWPPAAPQAELESPRSQRLPLQQPLGHEVAVQVHAPATHSCPPAQPDPQPLPPVEPPEVVARVAPEVPAELPVELLEPVPVAPQSGRQILSQHINPLAQSELPWQANSWLPPVGTSWQPPAASATSR